MLVALVAVTAAVFTPYATLVSDSLFDSSEPVLVLTWWGGAALLSGYGTVHVLAALADTRRFLADHGAEYASQGEVFCHALGQRLLPLVFVGFALVVLAIVGPGVGVPFAILVALGSFAAVLLGPPTAIPMNRRVSERLAEYRDE